MLISNNLLFTVIDRCSSSVGRTARGEQKVNLHQNCWYKGIVIHEIAHAIGFFHEQSRTDRDSYVKVLYQNIEVGKIPEALYVPFNSIKHLMTGPKGNIEFCFPETLSQVEGKQNSLFPVGPVIKCFVIPPNSKVEKKLRRNSLLHCGWLTNLPQFQGARPDHVRVESSCFVSMGSW